MRGWFWFGAAFIGGIFMAFGIDQHVHVALGWGGIMFGLAAGGAIYDRRKG